MAGKGVVQKHNSTAEVEGRERIFGNKGPQRGTWVVDRQTGKLVKLGEETGPEEPTGPYIQNNLEPFKSPIDGTLITCRRQLREHHKKHGTTDMRDYSKEHFDKAHKKRRQAIDCNTPEDKAHRTELLKRQFYKP